MDYLYICIMGEYIFIIINIFKKVLAGDYMIH